MTASPSVPRRTPAADFNTYYGRQGIGGWLLLFAIGQCFAILMNLAQLPEMGAGLAGEAWALGDTIPFYRPIVVLEAFCQVAIILGGVTGLVLLFRKRPGAPAFYAGFLAFIVFYGVVELAGVQLIYPKLIEMVQAAGKPAAEVRQMGSEASVSGLRMILFGLIWMLYWRKSERVARTFGTNP